MDISVSVIIPTYNRPLQTVAAVESVLRQTRQPAKIIVIDDGSSDVNREELLLLLKPFPVEVLLIPHCGHPGRVRNVGLDHVVTTHVAFLDSDDLWIQEKLEIQHELVKKGVRAQGSPYVTAEVPSPGVGSSVNAGKSLTLRDLLRANVLCNSSVLVETEILRRIGGLPISYGVRGIEDYAAWLRVAVLTDWMLLETPLVVYSDCPDLSMRGTNHFSISEGTLALWDFASWLSERGHPIPKYVQLSLKKSNCRLQKWAARQTRR